VTDSIELDDAVATGDDDLRRCLLGEVHHRVGHLAELRERLRLLFGM